MSVPSAKGPWKVHPRRYSDRGTASLVVLFVKMRFVEVVARKL